MKPSPPHGEHGFISARGSRRSHEIRELLEKDYTDAEKIILASDNLNTHKLGSLYQAFAREGKASREAPEDSLHTEAQELSEHRRN